jgi:hypothetical protein
MENIFAQIIFAHVFGDYFLQSKKMALLKSARGWRGMFWCAAHSLLYTAGFALFFLNVNPLFLSLVFLSHYPIDRWSLAQKWLDLIGGRNFLHASASLDENREINISFSCLVYVVVDNFMHLYAIWLIAKIIF